MLTRKSSDPNALDDDFNNDSLGDLFGDSGGDDFFGNSSDDLFSGFGDDNLFGNDNNTNNDFFGGGFNTNETQGSKSNKLETDKVFDGLCNFFRDIGFLTIDVIKSFRLRTLDDLGDIGRLGVLVGGGITVLGVILSIISLLGGFSLVGISSTLIFAGGTALCTSLIFLGISVYLITSLGLNNESRPDSISDIDSFLDSSVSLYNNNNDDFSEDESALNMDIMDTNYDCFNDTTELDNFEEDDNSFDSLADNWGNDSSTEMGLDNDLDDTLDNAFGGLNNIGSNLDLGMDHVQKVPILSRGYLYDTFIGLFNRNTYDFDKREELDRDSDEFINIKTLALKALANASKKDYEEVLNITDVLSVTVTLYTYELVIKRITSLTDTNRISLEMVAFFGKDSSDSSVSAVTRLDGDNYFIVINTDERNLVTLGDILSVDKYRDYFKSNKVALPCIAGIKPDGRCLNVDLKNYEAMLVAGKPRSGKSWYVLNIILPLMCFCTPEDVQFLIVDPKESNLFKRISKLPHVCGLHSGMVDMSGKGVNILNIFETLVNEEGSARKQLLNEHGVDTIWELRDMGIDLPVLFVVVDEVITLKGSLEGDSKKRFDDLLKTIITQLPSLGIKILLVPHRSQGVLDKTIRTNIAYACAVKAETEVIKETLDIKQWNIPLTEQGDIAIKLNGYPNAEFVRSPVIASSDGEVTAFVENMCKYWDKLEPKITNMKSLGLCNNKDYLYMQDKKGLNDELLNIQNSLKNL